MRHLQPHLLLLLLGSVISLAYGLIPVENSARDETPSRGTGGDDPHEAIHEKLFSGLAGQRLAEERAARAAKSQQHSSELADLQRGMEMVLARGSWAAAVRGLHLLEDLAHDRDHALALLHARFFPWLLPLLQCAAPTQVAPDWPRRVCRRDVGGAFKCTAEAPVCGVDQPCGFLSEQAALVIGSAAQNNAEVAEALCGGGGEGDDVLPLLLNLVQFPSHADVTRRAMYALSCLVRSHASCAASAAALPLDRLMVAALDRATSARQQCRIVWTSAVLATHGAMNATAAWCGRVAELVVAESDGTGVLDGALVMLDAGEHLPDECRDRLLAPHVVAAIDRRAQHDDLVAELAELIHEFQRQRALGVPEAATMPLV